jgi:hypothetical protein
MVNNETWRLQEEELGSGFTSSGTPEGGGSGEDSGVCGKESGNVRAKPKRCDGLKAQVGVGYGSRK